jgi:hypothetical protein
VGFMVVSTPFPRGPLRDRFAGMVAVRRVSWRLAAGRIRIGRTGDSSTLGICLAEEISGQRICLWTDGDRPNLGVPFRPWIVDRPGPP